MVYDIVCKKTIIVIYPLKMLIYPLKMVTMYGYYCFTHMTSPEKNMFFTGDRSPTLVDPAMKDVRAQSKTRPVQGVRNEVREIRMTEPGGRWSWEIVGLW